MLVMNKDHKVPFSYFFIFDRIMCVLVTLEERRHFAMLIIKSMHTHVMHGLGVDYEDGAMSFVMCSQN